MKILILVLSSANAPYRQLFETSQHTWDSYNVPGIDVIYYFGKNGIYQNNSIVIDLKENYSNLALKTKTALEWCLQNCEFDYVFRANASSFVYKENMFKHFKTLPKSVFQGLVAPYYDIGKFMWGVGYTISRDYVETIVNAKWDYSLMDDVSISFAAQSIGIELTGGHKLLTIDEMKEGKYQILNYGIQIENKIIADISEIDMSEHFHYRVKQDLNRHKDIEIMKQLYGNIKRNI